jgi:hypothetical protein
MRRKRIYLQSNEKTKERLKRGEEVKNEKEIARRPGG